MKKKNKLIRLAKTLMHEDTEAFSSAQFFEIAGSRKLESDRDKLKAFLDDLNNRNLDENTRSLIMQTKLKLKLLDKELSKVKVGFTF